jgi:hypothetical protein
MTLRRLPAVCILAAAAFLLPLSPAAAQFGLPREVIVAESIGSGQMSQIERYVGEWLPRLGSEDPLDIKRSRDNLLMPLREHTISVAFRQAYSDRLVPGLRQHAQDERDLVIANALRVAGELATPASVQLLEQKLQDGQAPVRFAAVAGIARAFASVRDASPAIGTDGIQQVTRRVGQQLRTESAPEIADACVRALATAMEIARPNYESVRGTAFEAIAAGVSERAKALRGAPDDGPMLMVLLRAGQVARDALSTNDPRLQLADAGVRQAAELNGHLLSYLVRRLQAGGFPHEDPESRELAGKIVATAENGIVLSASRLRGTQPALNLAADFAKANADGDRDFFRKAVELLGALSRPPFNFPAGHFQR